MLTVGRALWTTATDQWRAFPASGLAAVIYVSDIVYIGSFVMK